MTDTKALRDCIKNAGVKITYLADIAGITRQSLTNKIDNKAEFRASEIVAIADALHMTAKQRDSIFFN